MQTARDLDGLGVGFRMALPPPGLVSVSSQLKSRTTLPASHLPAFGGSFSFLVFPLEQGGLKLAVLLLPVSNVETAGTGQHASPVPGLKF